MNRNFLLGALAAVVGIGGCGSSSKQPMSVEQMIVADPLPLAKGARWTYDVTVKRYDPDTDKDTSNTMTWATEVLDVLEGDGVTAYRVKGWPLDLVALGEPGGKATATERTLLRSGNSFLFGTSPQPTLDGAEGWFSWPVIDGQRICPKREVVYCWQVAAVESGYAFTFFTGPDEQTFEIQPGTGVSRFHYAHHGTTNDIEAKLTSYSKGKQR